MVVPVLFFIVFAGKGGAPTQAAGLGLCAPRQGWNLVVSVPDVQTSSPPHLPSLASSPFSMVRCAFYRNDLLNAA
jgi:hypothetical protein